MSRLLEMVKNHDKFRPMTTKEEVTAGLREEKAGNPRRIPYFLNLIGCGVMRYTAHVCLSYMPNNNTKTEVVELRPPQANGKQ